MYTVRDLVKWIRVAWKIAPVESALVYVTLLFFLLNLANDAMFWMPPKFLGSDSIPDDLNSCLSDISSSKVCPIKVNHAASRLTVLSQINETLLESIPEKYSISSGGFFKPKSCQSKHKVAVIIPYRNRLSHLKIFVQHMHPFLTSQNVEYVIFVIEQNDDNQFNRAKLFNVGFAEVQKRHPQICCFIFHDVDLLPENKNNLYACSKSPRHMSVAVNTLRYRLLYPGLFGGVIAIHRDQFIRVNGFSNLYWSWGGEDDDFSTRILSSGLTITRWDPTISRYVMLSHKKESGSVERKYLLEGSSSRWKDEGFSSLRYRITAVSAEPLYTKISVNLT
ncbi:Beta-1,4-galactosyltransferase 4 [Halotydeus destructor]|nr:Beta-1,4-galactosyltransferase 4 [Halotydeus destructor]